MCFILFLYFCTLFWGLCFYMFLYHFFQGVDPLAPVPDVFSSLWLLLGKPQAWPGNHPAPPASHFWRVETVDGRTPAPVDSLSHFYQFFMGLQLVPSKVVQDFFHPPYHPFFHHAPPADGTGTSSVVVWAAFVGAGARSVCCTFSHPSW